MAEKETKELLPDEIGISKLISDACEKRGVMVKGGLAFEYFVATGDE